MGVPSCGTDASLKLWLKFDDGSGTTAADSSGNSHSASLAGSPAWSSSTHGTLPCAPNPSCLVFDGSDDIGTVTASSDFEFTTGQSITVTFWVNLDTTAGDRSVVTRQHLQTGSGIDRGNFYVEIRSGQMWFAYKDSGDSAFHIWNTSTSMTVSTWTHCALRYTYGTGSSIQAYKDGVPWSGVWNTGNGNADPYVNTTDIYVGARKNVTGGGLSFPLDGNLDDLRVYRGYLSAGDINLISGAPPRPNFPTRSRLPGRKGRLRNRHSRYPWISYPRVLEPVTTTVTEAGDNQFPVVEDVTTTVEVDSDGTQERFFADVTTEVRATSQIRRTNGPLADGQYRG